MGSDPKTGLFKGFPLAAPGQNLEYGIPLSQRNRPIKGAYFSSFGCFYQVAELLYFVGVDMELALFVAHFHWPD